MKCIENDTINCIFYARLSIICVISHVKWPLYPKCMTTISGLFKLGIIGKDSALPKVATTSEWPLYP